MLLSSMPQAGHLKAFDCVMDTIHLGITTELSAYLHLQTSLVMMATQLLHKHITL